jgi:hypothetical protein
MECRTVKVVVVVVVAVRQKSGIAIARAAKVC